MQMLYFVIWKLLKVLDCKVEKAVQMLFTSGTFYSINLHLLTRGVKCIEINCQFRYVKDVILCWTGQGYCFKKKNNFWSLPSSFIFLKSLIVTSHAMKYKETLEKKAVVMQIVISLCLSICKKTNKIFRLWYQG